MTVRTDTPSASAVSSLENPPKNRSSTTWLGRGSNARKVGKRVVQSDDVQARRRRLDLVRRQPTIPRRPGRASPLDARARRPPARGASSARWSRRSAPGSASARHASRADGRKTPARGQSVASPRPCARQRASGEPSPSIRAGQEERAVPGPPRRRSSTPGATRSRWRSMPTILSLSLLAAGPKA